MPANDKQVAGTHYQGEYQHWDWVHDLRLNYHAGNASKYVYRHRGKNGKQDLEKALHYINKAQELNLGGSIQVARHSIFWTFVTANKSTLMEGAALFHIMEGEWNLAAAAVQVLLEQAS